MDRRKIELSEQEVEELKDTIKFRTKVLMQLKNLNGIPREVWGLKISSKFQWGILLALVTGLIGMYLRR